VKETRIRRRSRAYPGAACGQATPAEQQPALCTLREDHRPAGERDAAERSEPSLFTVLERGR
jgi:hypothetical protein